MQASPVPPPQPSRLLLPALLAIFVAGLFPLASDYVLFHPDERHYVDAGIGMVRSGDYLTPRTAEGALRLKKPILPYWCTVAGFQTVGISPLGARLGFLLAGAAVVGLAWWGAQTAFGSRRAACFAAVIAMCQPALLISAPRSVPDVCLALGIQLSACGFIGLFKAHRAEFGWLAAAYGGGALAVLSKGLPGAAFVGFATIFVALRSPALIRQDWRRWMAAIGIGVAVSSSWFLLMAVLHSEELARQFTRDQLGPNRFTHSLFQYALQFVLCAALVGAMFGPWLWAASNGVRRSGRWHDLLACPGVELLLGWTVFYCVLASAINHVTPRYLLPAAAPLAIAGSGVLAQIDPPLLKRRLWWILAATASLSTASLLIALNLSLARRGWQFAAWVPLVALVLVVLHRARNRPAVWQSVAIAAALHAGIFCGGAGLSQWIGPDFGERVRQQLTAWQAEGVTINRILLVGEPAHATRVRLALEGQTQVICTPHPQSSNEADVLILSGTADRIHDGVVPKSATIPCGWREMRLRELLPSLFRGELAELLEQNSRTYCMTLQHHAALAEKPSPRQGLATTAGRMPPGMH